MKPPSLAHPLRRQGFALIAVITLLAIITTMVVANSVLLTRFHRDLSQLEKRQERRFDSAPRKKVEPVKIAPVKKVKSPEKKKR
jgi:hypothetical protein